MCAISGSSRRIAQLQREFLSGTLFDDRIAKQLFNQLADLSE